MTLAAPSQIDSMLPCATRVKNAVRMRAFPASGANLPLKLYAITKQTRFRLRNSKKVSSTHKR